MNIKGAAAVAALLATAWSGTALAQSGASFFDGRTVEYIVATDPGGGYDTYGRLVAEFMQKHLPGSTFIVRNMPGGGNRVGANYIFASEPDGLTIGSFNTGLIYGQLAGQDGIRFDLGEMSWIGKAASDARVLVVSPDIGIETYEDLESLESEILFGTCGVGCASMVESTILIEALDLPIRLITGYQGNEGELAQMRGEIQGQLASRSSLETFVANGNALFIAQIGGSDTDVPQLASFIEDESALQVIALVESQGTIGRLTVGPPGIPEDRLEALRTAYAAALSDPELLARAAQLGIPIDPLFGDSVRDAVVQALEQSPEIVELLRSALGE